MLFDSMMHQSWDHLPDDAAAAFADQWPAPWNAAIFSHMRRNGYFNAPPLKVKDAHKVSLFMCHLRKQIRRQA